MCERQTGLAKDKDRQKRKENTLTLTRAGGMTQRVQILGTGHTERCVKKGRQGTRKTGRQKRREGTLTFTRAGVYIMTQHVQKLGTRLTRTHQDNPHKQIQNLLMKNATVNTNKCKNVTVHTNK